MSAFIGTGQDARAHVRSESSAYRRSTVTMTGSASASTNASTGANEGIRHADPKPLSAWGSSQVRRDSRSTTADAFGVHAARHRNRLVWRVILGFIAVVVTWHYLGSWHYKGRVSVLTRERKTKLAGAGESHVLPKRWRDANDRETTVAGEELSTCKRVLLFKFTGTEGLASELLAYVRAGVIANKLGYTLLADDVDWNYGSLRDYFVPRPVYCRPPTDWFMTEAAKPLGSRRWQGEDRVWFSRKIMNKADDWIREETLDSEAMHELRNRNLGPILPEGETLPAPLEEVFSDSSAVLRDLWKPHDHLATMIRRQRMELGLGDGAVRGRKNSPTWGGAKKRPEDARYPGRAEAEDHDEEVREYGHEPGAERSDRGPVIGVHVPLASERPSLDELRFIGIYKTDRDDQFTTTLQGVHDAMRRLSKNSVAEPSYSRNHPTLFPSGARAYVAVLSGEKDSDVVERLAKNQLATNMEIQRTSTLPVSELRQWNEVFRVELDDKLEDPQGKVDASKVMVQFDQIVFNSLPRSLRVHLTRYLLRDLTTLSLYADAFVVHGSSSVGRLALLLAGEDAVVGPRKISGHGLGGRVRSVDGWWYPSSNVAALWG